MVGAGIIGNILSVVGVVICNKYITEIDGFKYMIFLSFLHFTVTAIGTRILLYIGVNMYIFYYYYYLFFIIINIIF